MARIRSVKPDFWQKEELAALSRDARLIYIGLWNLADEHGRARGSARFVKGQLLPYDDDLSVTDIDGLLSALADAGKVVRYVVDGEQYLFLPNLAEHQRLETKVDSKLPSPDEGVRYAPESPTQTHAKKSAPNGAEKSTLLYGTGNREQGPPTVSAKADRADELTATQRSKRITDAYAQAEPMCKWPAVNGVVLKAIKAQRWSDDEIRDALLRLAAEKRPVTVDVLRIELDGLPPRASPPTRNAQVLAIAMQRAEDADRRTG